MRKGLIKKLAAFTAAVYACTMMPVSLSFAENTPVVQDDPANVSSVDELSDDESSFDETSSEVESSSEDELSSEDESSEEESSSEDESSEEESSSEDESSEEESSSEDESSEEESSSEDESSEEESSSEDESSEDPAPVNVADLEAAVKGSGFTYTGSAVKPDVTITDSGKTLVKDKDYKLSYSNNVKAGTATVTVSGIGAYTGTQKLSFTIGKADISGLKASIPSLNYTYSGVGREPEPTLKFNGTKLVKGTDYTVSYKNNVNVGSLTATVTLTGKGNFKGSTARQYNITARSVSSCSVSSIANVVYNGKAKTPAPTVKYNSITFKKGTDYDLKYSSNTNTGTASIKITGKNRLTGTKTVTFKIVPVCVADYGAKPNDKKDDRDGIQAALSLAKSMPSGEKLEVFVPAGTYYLNKTLCIFSNTRLILDKNAKIVNNCDKVMICPAYAKGSDWITTGTGYSVASNIYISGGTWDANGKARTASQESKAALLFRNCKNITVTNTTVQNEYGNHFIICDGVSGLTVSDVTFKDFVSYKGSANNYDFYDGQSSAGEKKTAIGAIEALHLDFSTDKTPCTNVKVSGCTFLNVPSGIGTHHINAKYATNITIWNNTFKNVWFFCVHTSSFKSTKVYDNTATNSLALFRSEDTEAEVYNNIFTSVSTAPASRYNRETWLYSVLIQSNSKINFHDNTITSPVETGIRYKDNTSTTNTFKNNTVTGCGLDGMFITNSKVTMTYNTIKTCKGKGIRAEKAQLTATSNNITGCKDAAADFYSGCKSCTFKNNGIDAGATIKVSRDSSVTKTDNKKSLSTLKATIPYSSYTYNAGKAIKPTVTVKNGTTKISASNYTVTYSNNTKVGVATIIIEGKGSYRGFLKKTFVIKPKPQTLTLTTTSGAFKAAWTKDTTATGYQIQYSKDKSFKTGVTTYTVSKNTTTSVNFSSKPKTGETWYVKYRAYYEVNGSKYGNYSSVKSVKVK